MAKLVFLLALCVFPAIAMAARPAKNPFLVKGKVYCDPCRAGFETSAVNYIEGAKVRVECKNRLTMQTVYSKEAKTDAEGMYQMLVDEDRVDELCDAMLVDSAHPDCAEASPGRERARVILTRNNGMASDERFVNAMGFQKVQPMSFCSQLLKQYLEVEYEN